MALNANTLADDLREKMLEVEGASDNQAMRDFCKAIAEAVVEHIKTSAVVDGTAVT